MAFTVPIFTNLKYYDCHYADFHGTHSCPDTTLKNCYTESHENLTKGLAVNTN
jgi:hypothetical protein